MFSRDWFTDPTIIAPYDRLIYIGAMNVYSHSLTLVSYALKDIIVVFINTKYVLYEGDFADLEERRESWFLNVETAVTRYCETLSRLVP